MQLNANKESICINQLVGQKNDILEVEGDVIVNDIKPDVLNTISVNGNVCVYKKEVIDGKIRLDGAVNVYIIYLADDDTGGIRSLNTSVDFTHTIDFPECRNGMNIDETLSIKNMECKVINSRKINVRAFLDTRVKVYSNDNIEMISNVNSIDDVQCLNSTIDINTMIGNASTKVYAKDTVMIDSADNLAEILKSDVSIINKDIKISYNKILAKSEMQVRIMYLTEDNRINTVSSNIPAMGFVDMPNVSDSNLCNTKYKLKNIQIRPNNMEEHSISVDAEIEITCSVYEPRQVNVIQDLYSPTSDVTFSKRQVTALVNKDLIRQNCVVQEQISVPEIDNNRIFDVQVTTVIQKENVRNGGVDFEGEISLEFLYEANSSSRFSSKIVKLPLNYTINNANIDENTSIDTNVEIQTQDFVVLSDGMVQSRIEMTFEVTVARNEKLNVIDNIEIEEKKNCNGYSMVIYFVKPRDTLWDIAKKFDSTVEEIARVNEIENVDMIMPGTQLYIPRYCSQRTA